MNLIPAYNVISDKRHRYYVDGEVMSSVTTITGVIDKSPQLQWWAVGQCLKYIQLHFNEVQDKSDVKNFLALFANAQSHYKEVAKGEADIGTEIHDAILLMDTGGKPDFSTMSEPAKLGFSAYCDWRKKVNYKPVASELAVASKKYKFGGRLDSIAYAEDELRLLDWKSSKAIYAEYWLQVAGGYYQGLRETYPVQSNPELEKLKGIQIIRFGKVDGEFEPSPVMPIEQAKALLPVFLACQTVLNWKKENDKYEKKVSG